LAWAGRPIGGLGLGFSELGRGASIRSLDLGVATLLLLSSVSLSFWVWTLDEGVGGGRGRGGLENSRGIGGKRTGAAAKRVGWRAPARPGPARTDPTRHEVSWELGADQVQGWGDLGGRVSTTRRRSQRRRTARVSRTGGRGRWDHRRTAVVIRARKWREP
jgi:hypothetical protein